MRHSMKPVLVCTVLLAGCSTAAPANVGAAKAARPKPAVSPAPTLLLATASGVEGVSATDGALHYRVANGVVTADGSTVMATEGDRLVVRDARTGTPRQHVVVGPGLVVATVSANGQSVALTAVAPTTYLPAGRTKTPITVVHLPLGTVRPYVLDGNLVPDAFSADGSGLFMVSYLPAPAPDHYQITYMDFTSGDVSGVYGRQKEPPEDMRGLAGMKALSPDRTVLYTLYLRPPAPPGTSADPKLRAEVHTLKLDQFWAHCVDLPADFGGSDLKASALAVSIDGRLLYVVDRAVRRLVEIDTDALTVTRNIALPIGASSSPAAVAVGGDGHLYVSDGSSIVVLRTDTLAVSGRWTSEGPITGLVWASDSGRLLASRAHQVDAFGPGGGRAASTPVPSDATAISHVLP